MASRNFHSVSHVFDVAKGQTDPILILSAYFHDLIYHSVDGGFSDEQDNILSNVFSQEGSDLHLSREIDGDTLLQIVIRIFGLTPGQELKGVVNEFLSAVIACRELEEVLGLKQLVQIACCIEATVPFRSPNLQGKTAREQLYERLQDTNEEFGLDLTEDEMVSAVQRATQMANLDVGNFGTTDRAYFLDKTWSLLPENSEPLRKKHLSYTVQDFQYAVFKMSGFFSFVTPELVFSEFRGVPGKEELQRMRKEAYRNLEIGKAYVASKVLSISLVAAIAELTGGDAPIALFMGDLPSPEHNSDRLGDLLPDIPKHTLDVDDDVYAILKFGRTSETSFDVRQSPLGAFLYGWMGDAQVFQVLEDIHPVYPMDTEKAWKLLAAMPREPLSIVADRMSIVAVSRAESIRNVMKELLTKREMLD